jgi:hypothetical protein
MRNRPFVEKFETGEYLHSWNGYEPGILGFTGYSENIGIGEDRFLECVGQFNGIGDVEWWVKTELDKLNQDGINELNLICGYKTYLKKFITNDLIVEISKIFGCNTFHVSRTGVKNILELCNQFSDFHEKILAGSALCLDEKTIQYKAKQNHFKIVSYNEYKKNKNN